MSGKKNKQKQLRKEAQRNDPVHWEQSWIEQVLPSINEFAGRSAERRFLNTIAADDRKNWTFGSDIDVEHERRRVVITEWLVPIVGGKAVVYLDDLSTLNPDMQAHRFVLRYDHLQEAARDATKRKGAVNLARYYLPEVVVLPGKKGWEAELELIDQTGRSLVAQAKKLFDAHKDELVEQYGALNDDGIYMGLRLWYDREENLLQLVEHKRHALDVIESKDGEINYIDLRTIDVDASKTDYDKLALNVRSAVGRHVAEHGDWVRVVKPSPAAYTRFSGDLADYLMSISEEVYKRACDAILPVDGSDQLKVDFEYNLMNGGLEASYQMNVVTAQDDSDELVSSVEKVEIELKPEDRAAILMVSGRIEPDMWFHVQADFLRRFLGTYGKGNISVSSTVLEEA